MPLLVTIVGETRLIAACPTVAWAAGLHTAVRRYVHESHDERPATGESLVSDETRPDLSGDIVQQALIDRLSIISYLLCSVVIRPVRRDTDEVADRKRAWDVV